jgi:hypothetical protein
MLSFNNLGRIGRLGNQMFQYSALKGIAKKNQFDFCIPESNFSNPWADHQLFDTFKMTTLKNKGVIKSNKIFQETQFNFEEKFFNLQESDLDIIGYFQTEKYFFHVKDELLIDFEFVDEVFYPCQEMMNTIESPIALHVRRTDYLTKSHEHPPQTIEYYETALSHFGGDRNVIIFTDDLKWCKEQELFSPDRFMISESRDNRVDLCLMSLCSDYIIANSSFSWWGAWLSKNENPTVIAPKKWFGDGGYTRNHSTEDIIPTRWRTI